MSELAAPPTSLIRRIRGGIYHTLNAISPSLLRVVSKRFAHSCGENWRYRAKLVRQCPDYAHLSPVPDAGNIVDGCQIMHNGLKVLVGSYYGEEASILFARTKGVHEPQEERVFDRILKLIPAGGVIIELGAYWSFYSMWFCKEVPQARVFLVEPIASNLEFGRRNFALNGFTGDFTQAYVGRAAGLGEDGIGIICVDQLVRSKGIEHVNILHCDIQGFELDMLKGADVILSQRKVDYLFVSTHSNQLHADCEAHLRQRGFVTIASVNLDQSYSMDGILVMADPRVPQPEPIHISLRSTPH